MPTNPRVRAGRRCGVLASQGGGGHLAMPSPCPDAPLRLPSDALRHRDPRCQAPRPPPYAPPGPVPPPLGLLPRRRRSSSQMKETAGKVLVTAAHLPLAVARSICKVPSASCSLACQKGTTKYTWMMGDCGSAYETMDAINKGPVALHPILQELVKLPFFMYFMSAKEVRSILPRMLRWLMVPFPWRKLKKSRSNFLRSCIQEWELTYQSNMVKCLNCTKKFGSQLNTSCVIYYRRDGGIKHLEALVRELEI